MSEKIKNNSKIGLKHTLLIRYLLGKNKQMLNCKMIPVKIHFNFDPRKEF